MRENLGFKVGDVVTDGDQYEARIVSINSENFEAELDYSEFPSDVPAEAETWPLDELSLVDIDDEIDRRAEFAHLLDDTDAY